jgi:hypothetical protein
VSGSALRPEGISGEHTVRCDMFIATRYATSSAPFGRAEVMLNGSKDNRFRSPERRHL